MKHCPNCFEELADKPIKCPHCQQYILDPLIEIDYRSVEKKNCIFCGQKILKEARICKYCQKWIDEVDQAAKDFD